MLILFNQLKANNLDQSYLLIDFKEDLSYLYVYSYKAYIITSAAINKKNKYKNLKIFILKMLFKLKLTHNQNLKLNSNRGITVNCN